MRGSKQRVKPALILLLIGVMLSSQVSARTDVNDYETFYQQIVETINRDTRPDASDTEHSVMVMFDSLPISFRLENGKLDQSSLCFAYRSCSPEKLQRCQKTAAKMFRDTCKRLADQPVATENYDRLKQMYCGAAEAF